VKTTKIVKKEMQGPYARKTNKDSSSKSNIEGTPGTTSPPKERKTKIVNQKN
jgi:hypothetical protein